MKNKFFIITTVPDSFIFFKGQIQVLKQNFDVEMVSSPGKNFKNFCELEGVIGHRLHMQREISVIKDIKSLINMLVLFYKNNNYVNKIISGMNLQNTFQVISFCHALSK